MNAILIAMIIVGLLAYGLERNRSRQSQPRTWMAGSSDIQDRDLERFQCELRAIR